MIRVNFSRNTVVTLKFDPDHSYCVISPFVPRNSLVLYFITLPACMTSCSVNNDMHQLNFQWQDERAKVITDLCGMSLLYVAS